MRVYIIKKDNIDISKQIMAIRNANISITDDFLLSDFYIIFGGDGTLLKVVPYILKHNKPILSVNFGKLGFLTTVQENEFNKALLLIKENKYSLDKRFLLETKVNNEVFYALNEATIIKNSIKDNLIHLTVYTNEIKVNSYRSDGVIFSTPTGSTAYSLSAGGPILHKDLSAICITAINAQKISTRPIVIGSDNSLNVFVYNNSLLHIDGNKYVHISKEDKINIKLSNKYVEIFNFEDDKYYKNLRNKLHFEGEYD